MKLIVEMEMPKDLAVIVTILPDGRIIKHLGYRDKKQIGKIVGELPEQHGDLIDRDALIADFEWCKGQAAECNRDEWDGLIMRVSEQPTVDAVPVVRCGKCANRKYCEHPLKVDSDWFCANGERRSE